MASKIQAELGFKLIIQVYNRCVSSKRVWFSNKNCNFGHKFYSNDHTIPQEQSFCIICT